MLVANILALVFLLNLVCNAYVLKFIFYLDFESGCFKHDDFQ